jgi:hypothetical protein
LFIEKLSHANMVTDLLASIIINKQIVSLWRNQKSFIFAVLVVDRL